MSRLSLKNDFKDGEVLYGKELSTNNDATVAAVNDNYEKILELQQLKADITNVDEKLATKVDNSTFNDAINSLNTTKADKSALNLKADKSEVDLKADKTELQEGLAAKADADYVNTQLGLKADKTEVNSALNLKADKTEVVGKADTSYVNGQLALKADKTELASGLASKADTTYVDNQLAGKVNVNTYNDDMADKADKSTIGNLEDLNTSNKDSIVDAINSIQTSTVPIATTSTPGIVKPDGTTIIIDSDGTIHSVGGGGGTGGTTDYNALDNKPQIEGNTLNGNKTADELGLMSKTNINSALANKADKSTTYTKTEVDNAINTATSGKADKTYVDTQLGNKVDTSTYTAGLADKVDNATYTAGLATKADVLTTYTKDEVDGKINTAVAPKADKTYVDTQLTTKANANNVYTKEEIDSDLEELSSNFTTSLNTKANASDVYSKTDVDGKINTATSTKADTSYVNEQLALKADKSDTYTKEEVDDMFDNPTITGDTLPVGSITLWSGSTTPTNWLLCDGREVSRETYSELFAAIGTIWGAGDGSTSFNLPDFTDKFTLGAGGDVDLAETGGEKEVTLTVAHIPPHNHSSLVYNSTGFGGQIASSNGTGGNRDGESYNIGNTGGGQAHNNMPPYVGSYYVIKAKQSAGVIANVVDTLESTSKTDALSANMGKKLGARVMPVTLFDGDVATDGGPITLSDNYENYEYIEVYATTTDDNELLVPVVKVLKGFNKFQIVFNTSPSTGWINMNVDFSISGNTITPIALRQVYINSSKSVERVTLDLAGYGWNLHIRKVLGYK